MLSGLETAENTKAGLVFAKTVSQIEKERAQEENSEDQSTDNGNDSPKGSQGEVSGNHFNHFDERIDSEDLENLVDFWKKKIELIFSHYWWSKLKKKNLRISIFEF